MLINYSSFKSLKGELEAEGLSRMEVAAETIFAAKNGLDYLVKISGAEAKSDINFLIDLGITSIVCPMIETKFAMSKYMDMLTDGVFLDKGVTIETITAVKNIKEIIETGIYLTGVTIGRTDLTSSWGGNDAESDQTMSMVREVASVAKEAGLKVTMGGSISQKTKDQFLKAPDLMTLIDFIETRKTVMSVFDFIDGDGFVSAMNLEKKLLNKRAASSQRTLDLCKRRVLMLDKRIA